MGAETLLLPLRLCLPVVSVVPVPVSAVPGVLRGEGSVDPCGTQEEGPIRREAGPAGGRKIEEEDGREGGS